jgi:SAM-dependent methyltransferase
MGLRKNDISMGKEINMTKERLERDPEGGKRIINKTDLQIDTAEKRLQIHRDYGSHFFRWSHCLKFASKLKNKKSDLCVLDLGCGKSFPFLKVLYTNKVHPKYYCSSDIRDLDFEELHQEMVPNFEHEFQKHDFAQEVPTCKYGGWDLILCLEAIEHNSKEAGLKILDNIKSVMNPETLLFLSTPAYNGKDHAGNHIFEWTYTELTEALGERFTIEAQHGTFASQSDITAVMSPCELEIFEKLRNYYDSNVLSIIFAPNHPEASRNVIHRLRLKA